MLVAELAAEAAAEAEKEAAKARAAAEGAAWAAGGSSRLASPKGKGAASALAALVTTSRGSSGTPGAAVGSVGTPASTPAAATTTEGSVSSGADPSAASASSEGSSRRPKRARSGGPVDYAALDAQLRAEEEARKAKKPRLEGGGEGCSECRFKIFNLGGKISRASTLKARRMNPNNVDHIIAAGSLTTTVGSSADAAPPAHPQTQAGRDHLHPGWTGLVGYDAAASVLVPTQPAHSGQVHADGDRGISGRGWVDGNYPSYGHGIDGHGIGSSGATAPALVEGASSGFTYTRAPATHQEAHPDGLAYVMPSGLIQPAAPTSQPQRAAPGTGPAGTTSEAVRPFPGGTGSGV